MYVVDHDVVFAPVQYHVSLNGGVAVAYMYMTCHPIIIISSVTFLFLA